MGLCALQFTLMRTGSQHRSPAAWAGITATCTVRINLDLGHGHARKKGCGSLTIRVQLLRLVLTREVGSMSPPITFLGVRQRGRIGVSVYTRLRALIM